MDDDADVPAGWYEQDDGRFRYWDGDEWRHYWDDKGPAPADDRPLGLTMAPALADDDDFQFPIGRVLAVIAFFGFGALIYFGVLDIGVDEVKEEESATVAENPDCLGYKLVRRLETNGVVTEYRAVDAPASYDCQYVLNDGIVVFGASEQGQQQIIFVESESKTLAADDLVDDINEALEKYGFAEG